MTGAKERRLRLASERRVAAGGAPLPIFAEQVALNPWQGMLLDVWAHAFDGQRSDPRWIDRWLELRGVTDRRAVLEAFDAVSELDAHWVALQLGANHDDSATRD